MKGWILPLVVILVPLASHAAAESGPAPAADLTALLREAEANSPVLLAAAARLQASRRAPSQAGALPDPEASVSYTNDGVSRFTLGESIMSNLTLTWRQEVPHPGKRGESTLVAAADAEVAGSDLERSRLEVGATVKSAYADLYRLDRTADILEETRLILVSLAEAARRRYEVGEGVQESVLKAQTEILRVEAQQARIGQERRAAELRLNAGVGRAADTPIGPADLLPAGSLPDDIETLADAAVAAAPAVAGRAATVRREEAGLRLARLDLKPDFVWSASYANRDGLDPMVMGMFGLRLPLYRSRKQAQGLLQAEARLEAARQDLADVQVRTRATVRDLVARVQRADRLLALYGQGVIPQARTTLDSAQSAYGVGRIGFLDVLNDLTVLLEARMELAAEEADRVQTLAALEPLLAREIVRPAEAERREGGGHASAR